MIPPWQGRYTSVAAMGGVSFTAEATALFARHTVQWPIPWKVAVNAFIEGLKTDGLWAKSAGGFIRFRADPDNTTPNANTQRPLLNMLGATYDGVVTGTVTFDVDGAAADGVSGYINGGFRFTGHQDAATLWVYNLTEGQSAATDIGNTNAYIFLRNASDQTQGRIMGGSAITSTTVTNSTGLTVATRIDAANSILYPAHAVLVNNSSTSQTPTAADVWEGAKNAGSPTFSSRKLMFTGGAYATFDATDIANLNTRISNLRSALGI